MSRLTSIHSIPVLSRMALAAAALLFSACNSSAEGPSESTRLTGAQVKAQQTLSKQGNERHCLAKVLYTEAHANRRDQAAVAAIVFTRKRSGLYGSSVCSVVHAPNQFAAHLPRKKDHRKWQSAWTNAGVFLSEYQSGRQVAEAGTFNSLQGCTSFHADEVKGVRYGKRCGTIGGNVFYRPPSKRTSRFN